MSNAPPDSDLAVWCCDALQEAVESDANLPEHNYVPYRRPLIVTPQMTPLLCVWLLAKNMVPGGTRDKIGDQIIGGQDSEMYIGVSWQEETVENALTLTDYPEKSAEMLSIMGRMETSVRLRSIDGLSLAGVQYDDVWECFPVGVQYEPPPEMATGLVDGYALTVQVNVAQKG